MPKFCPTCGNSSENVPFYGNFCENCSREKFGEKIPIIVEIKRCKRCGNIRVGNVDVPMSHKALSEIIKHQLHKFDVRLLDNTDETARIYITETTEKGKLIVEKEIQLIYKKHLCEMCYKKACSYYEAVVQLRGNPAKIEKFIEKITRYIEENNGFITKVEGADNGLDVYISSKASTTAFMSKMRLKPTMSYTLAGIKSGKKLYKNTYALHYT